MTIEHSNIYYSERIPNNVGLADNRRLRRALESWQPNYLKWWQELGPDQSTKSDVYLRTAVSVERDGWANFDFVKMPDSAGAYSSPNPTLTALFRSGIIKVKKRGRTCQANIVPHCGA